MASRPRAGAARGIRTAAGPWTNQARGWRVRHVHMRRSDVAAYNDRPSCDDGGSSQGPWFARPARRPPSVPPSRLGRHRAVPVWPASVNAACIFATQARERLALLDPHASPPNERRHGRVATRWSVPVRASARCVGETRLRARSAVCNETERRERAWQSTKALCDGPMQRATRRCRAWCLP